MSHISHLRCTGCSAEYPADAVMNLCPADQRPVEIIMDLERLVKDRIRWHRAFDAQPLRLRAALSNQAITRAVNRAD